jgi:hypothetical protein
MACVFHTDRDDVSRCEHCQRPLCAECVAAAGGKPRCRLCQRSDAAVSPGRASSPYAHASPRPPAPKVVPHQGAPTFDFVRGLKFFFQDPAWISKLAILTLASLLAFVLLGLPLLYGYGFRLTARVARGEAAPLPSWAGLGGIFTDGLRSIAFHLVHALVLLGPSAAIGFLCVGIGGSAEVFDLERLSAMRERNALLPLAIAAFYGLTILSLLLAVAYMPAARARFAATDSFRKGLDVASNVAFIRRNAANYVLQYPLFMAANVLSNAGYLLCCVGILPATLWAVCVLNWGEGEVVRCDSAFR